MYYRHKGPENMNGLAVGLDHHGEAPGFIEAAFVAGQHNEK